ncbi:MAG: hypothetical protein JW751_21085 [Polyangiaceae bacterium]|nr:hypothetical protein [Polyangiaceae bacterium]
MGPVEPAAATSEEADLAAIAPTVLARIAGGALALAGFFTGLLGVQTATIIRFRGVGAIAVTLMLLFGVTTLICGWKVTRMRGWAAVGGTVGAGSIAVLGLVWLVFSISRGLLSLLAFGILPLSVTGAALGATVIGAGIRADAARRRLRDVGLEAGD